MQVQMFKSKIHRATVTQARVQIVNNNNGERFETYVIRGERNSGVICLNGAAARKVHVGDIIIIISYAFMDYEEAKQYKPITLIVDGENKIINSKL